MSVTINGGAPSAPQIAEFQSVFELTPASHASNTSNPHSVTKAQVGLSNADNTADSAKPVSTAQQTALDLKLNASLVTAAALTVLDDTTVAAMVNTLGGATSSGTGGLVRATAPTIDAPVITGVAAYSGAVTLSETALGDFVAHTAAGAQVTATMTTAAELTLDATPGEGRLFGPVRVPADSGGPYTLTIPSSVDVTAGAAITTVSVPASGQVELTFKRIGSTNYVYGVPAAGGGSGTVTSVAASVPTGLTISGSPVTTTGTLAIGLDTGYVIPTQAALDGKQPLDSDLTTIASLTATTDNFIQSKSGAWASRTVAQVAADLNGTGLVATNLALRHIPQNSQSTAYTAVAADAGGHILHPTADNNARTFTIPANSSVAYPIGTAITFVNLINTVTIAITTDTLILAGAGTTGSRTLAANGVATAMKITSTSWIINGTGLT